MTVDTPHSPPSAFDETSPEPEALWAVDGSGTLRAYDERTDRVTAHVDLGRRCFLVSGGGFVWAFGADDGSVAMLDPAAGCGVVRPAIGPVPPKGPLGFPYYAHDAMWIWGSDQVWRVSGPGQITSSDLPPADHAYGGYYRATATSRWVFLAGGGRLLRIDPATGAVADEIGRFRAALERGRVRPGPIHSLATCPEGLVVTLATNRPDVVVLDTDTVELKSVTRLPDGFIVDLCEADPYVWALSNGGTAMRVGGTGEPSMIRTDVEVGSAVLALDSLWIVNDFDGELLRLHLPSGQITARLRIPDRFWENRAPEYIRLIAGRRTMWLICRPRYDVDVILRVDPDAARLDLVAECGQFTVVDAVASLAPRHR